jgi:pimeloyl-ACP methyl ester carboxylesterase
MRRLSFFVLAVFVLGVMGLYLAGGYLAAPRMHGVGDPPAGFSAEQIPVQRHDGEKIAGWFAAGESGKPGVLLLHSVRSDRREMVGRAKFLLEAGYSVLLIDMQGHGETRGENITFGYRESFDAHEALSFLRARVKGRKVGVIGVSLGGAASLLGESPVNADAVVLEAVYISIESAVKNRVSIRVGKLGEYLAPLLTWQIEPRLGIPLTALSPLQAIKRLKAPVMVIGGAEDRRTLREESQRLFEQAAEPKRLWLIEGAKHQNFHLYAKAEYEERILEFLGVHLLGSNGQRTGLWAKELPAWPRSSGLQISSAMARCYPDLREWIAIGAGDY